MLVILLMVLVVVVYYPTWGYHLIIDDVRRRALVEAPGSIVIGKNLVDSFLRRFYGLGTLYRVGGKVNIRNEHILSTVIHTINTVLVYVAFGMNDVAMVTAVLYAVNPVGLQTSVWLNGRRYAMAVMMMLGMMIGAANGGIFGWCGMLLYPLAVLLQPVAFLSAMVYGWVGVGSVIVVGLLLYPMYRQKINERLEKIHSLDIKSFRLRKLIPIVKIFRYSIEKMVFPGRLMMCDGHLFYWGMTNDGNNQAYKLDWSFIRGCLYLVSSIVVFFMLPDNERWYWSLMVGSVLQWSGFITAVQHSADRYLAVSMVFMMFFISYFVNAYCGEYWLYVLIALATYYVVNLKTSLGMYKDMEYFWNYHFYYDPGGTKCREFKATHQIRSGDKFGAWETVREGLCYNPNDFKLNLLAANCCFLCGDQVAVMRYLKAAKENCYIGQEFIYKDVCRGIFGMDLDIEMDNINKQKSNLPSKVRDNVKKVYDMVMA